MKDNNKILDDGRQDTSVLETPSDRSEKEKAEDNYSRTDEIKSHHKTFLHFIIEIFSTAINLLSYLINKGQISNNHSYDNKANNANISDKVQAPREEKDNASVILTKLDARHFIIATVILLAGIITGWLLLSLAPQAEKQKVEHRTPLIEAIEVEQVAKRIPIYSRGTVEPRTQLNLINEVEGHVTYLSDNLESGRIFNKGELLLTIDPTRYKLEVTKKQSAVASAELFLEKARATAKVARKGAKRNASAYALHIPQLNEAKAKLAAAEADLEVAKLHLENTQIKAPFSGRVKHSDINLGQYVNSGALVASIYSLDAAEIRLPISNKQIKLIDLPWFYTNNPLPALEESSDNIAEIESTKKNLDFDRESNPSVEIVGQFANKEYRWRGEIKHAEGGLDENQLIYLVGHVKDPYRRDKQNPNRPPLEPGLFVEAEIEGKFFDAIFEIPREALHGKNKVWLVDENNRVLVNEVNVIYRGPKYAYVLDGLSNEDRLVITNLDYVVNGMEVRINDSSQTTQWSQSGVAGQPLDKSLQEETSPKKDTLRNMSRR
ncbi:efflux RND transporter periplasmic adaptor subunit [Pleionea sediminis]|uniref:efflux RND transporter periplasmic adaptor subunit n=1 Tax=Pleionea sediminis TaxID=2569479 RepID=UPI001184C48D|nr:efflux RND transporter periplasmic adaptor subunit [Pleionea sediminis]